MRSRNGSLDQSFHSVVETPDGDYIIGMKNNLYRTTGMDAILIKVDSRGNELWNMTAGGDGNQVVNSMQQARDGGLILARSMRNLDTEGHIGAMLMKVGKMGGNKAKLDTDGDSIDNLKQGEAINNTIHPDESLPRIMNTKNCTIFWILYCFFILFSTSTVPFHKKKEVII